METWLQRKMGSGFKSEVHCPYTGQQLFQQAIPTTDKPLVLYVRGEDKRIMRARPCNDQEIEWINENPSEFNAILEAFQKWGKGK